MSHLTHSMVEQFFELEKESARGVLRKEMDSAMDTIFKQMKRKLMMLVESGPGPEDPAHGLDQFGVTIDREQQLSNDTKHIPSLTTNSHVRLNKMSIASNLYQNVLVDGKEQLYESSNQISSTSTNVDNVTSNTEKGSENSGTDLEGQEGEHSANDSNEQSQSSDLLAIYSTSTGQRSNRIDVSWSPSQTVQCPNESHINQGHLGELVDNEPQLNNEDTSTRVDHGTSNIEKGGKNASTERDHMANDSNDQTMAKSSDAFSPSTSTGPRSNRIALKKKLPTVSTDHNVTKPKEPSSNRTVKRSKKTIEGDVGEDGENELDRMGSEQSEAEFWFDEDGEDCDCSECMDEYVDNCHSAEDVDESNESVTRPTKRPLLENDEEQGAMLESSDNARHVPSTSTVRKRKSSSMSRKVHNKRQKTVTSGGSNKFLCKSPGCGKSFLDNANLAAHERIHLGIKPFSCTWPGCRYSSVQKANVVRHVHTQHFKLPRFKSEQARLNIVDNRNPEDYVQVNDQLLERRL